MLKSTIKSLSGHTLIYSLSWIASSAASIFLLPVYTRFLSRADYGILELLDYTNVIVTIIVLSGLNAAIPRFFNDTVSGFQRQKILSTATAFVLISGTVCCLIGFSFEGEMAELVLGNKSYSNLIRLNVILLFVQLIINVSSITFIVEKESKVYLSYMLARMFISIVANLYFIVVLKVGILGMLYGNIAGNGSVAICMAAHTVIRNGWKFSFRILGQLVIFGFPLVPASILATLMHNADRFLIRHYCSLDDVGIYSLGYKFPFMLNALILQSFSFIWNGATMYEISKEPDAPYQFGRITTYVIGFFLFVQLGLSVFAPALVKILADEKFFPAHRVIPLVALGLCFHAFYFFFSVGSFLKEKTWVVNLAYLPASVIGIFGNVVLLPKFGYMAAAFMAVVTYLIFAVLLYFVCRRLIEVKYEFKRLGQIFLVALLSGTASMLLQFESLLAEIVKGISIILFFILVLMLTRWFTKGEQQLIREKFIHAKQLIGISRV